MKKILAYALILGLLPTLWSCSGSDASADAEKLLQTVPSDAAVVAVLDLESILDHVGAKADGTKVKDGENLLKMLGSINKTGDLKQLLDGESSVVFTSAVIFNYQGGMYLTGLLDDAETFRGYVQKKFPDEKWTNRNGLWSLRDVVQIGNQFWLAESVHPDLDKILLFSKQTKAQSILSLEEYADNLVKCDHDVAMLGSISGMIDASEMSFGDRTTFRLVSGMCFDNATWLAGHLDIDKEVLKGEVEVLDNKFKSSKCELKMGKIDVDQVIALGGDANTLMAVAVPQKLVKQIIDAAQSFGGNLPKMYEDFLLPLDGTIAIAAETSVSGENSGAPSFMASIATKGNQAPLMQQLQSQGMDVTSEGNLLIVKHGNYGKGAFAVKDAAPEMKDACMAIRSSVSEKGRTTDVQFLLKESGKSLKLLIEIRNNK